MKRLFAPPAFSADLQKGVDAHDRGDYATALKEFTPLAEQGNAEAQFILGSMYYIGQGVAQDDATAVKWYRLAAEQGDAKAQYNLGDMYRNGRGVAQDDATAGKWYRLAAEQGLANAQYNLGVMYVKGRGVAQDDATAVKWYRLAAEQGNADAQRNLGNMYHRGEGVAQDDAAAVKWFRLAAEQGDAMAQYNLGFMYGEGRGVMKFIFGVIIWFVQLIYLLLAAVLKTIMQFIFFVIFFNENTERGKTYVRAYYFLDLLDNGNASSLEEANRMASFLFHSQSNPDVDGIIIRRAMAHNQEYGGIQLITIEEARTKGFTG